MPSILSRFLSLFSLLGKFLKGTGVFTLIVLLLLIAFVWILGPHISIADQAFLKSFSSRLSATFILIFTWLVFLAIYKSMAGKAALKDPEAAAAKKVTEKEQGRIKEEYRYIKNLFKDAVQVITTSNFYGPESRSRYALPWYLVIGAENSGKTSALLNSGLKFPINEQADRSLYTLKATERCEILFSNQAVFIDTPGRYTEAKEGSLAAKSWFCLLRELFKARPSRPLNGVIVCMSLRDIMSGENGRPEHLGRIVRERLSDVLKKLRCNVPVYLILTKGDAVPGFAQFFSNLSRSEREQIFGAVSALGSQMQPGQVRKEMEELLVTINSQFFGKIHQERDMASRGAMFMFPRELYALAPNLEDFIFEAFGHSRYHRPVLFRGFFFSSSLSAHDALAVTARQGERVFQTGFQASLGDYAKGFFLSSLFNDAIIPEAGLAGDDRESIWNRRASQYGAKILTFAAFLVTGIFLAISFSNNYSKIDALDKKYSDFKTTVAAQTAADPQYVLPELKILEASTTIFKPETDSVIKYGLGLYQGEKAQLATKAAYKDDLNARFLPFLRFEAAQKVDRLINLNGDNISELKKSVRAYLMFCLPQHLDEGFLSGWQAAQWSDRYQGDAQVQADLAHQLRSLFIYGIEPSEPDYDLLERARQAMFKIPPAELAYQELKEEAEIAAHPPFSFRRALGDKVSPFDGDTFPIPYLYTKAGFENYMVKRCPAVIRELTSDSWVFGVSDAGNKLAYSDLDVNNIHQAVGLLYYRDYIKFWAEAVKALTVRQSETLGEAARLAEQLGGAGGPALLVLRELRANTTLVTDLSSPVSTTLAEGEAGKEAAENPQESLNEPILPQADALAVKQYFAALDSLLLEDGLAGANLSSAGEAMSATGNYFAKLAVGDAVSEEVFDAVTNLASGQDETLRRLEIAAGKLPPEVGRWYQSVLDGALNRMLALSADHLNRVYQVEVVNVYNGTLRDAFPLNSRSGRDASLDDFTDFFGAGGVVASFYDEYIIPFTSASGALKPIMGRQLPLSGKALAQLKRADLVRSAFFAGGGNLSVSYNIKPSTMDSMLKTANLTHAGKTISYWHGPAQEMQAHWPGSRGAILIFETLGGLVEEKSVQGEWGIFRLLQSGTFRKREGSGNGMVVELKSNTYWLRLNVQYSNRANPFDPGIYTYAPPPSLR